MSNNGGGGSSWSFKLKTPRRGAESSGSDKQQQERNNIVLSTISSPRKLFSLKGKSMSVPSMSREQVEQEEEDFSFLRGEAPKPRNKTQPATTSTVSTSSTLEATSSGEQSSNPIIPPLNLTNLSAVSPEDTPRTRLRKSSIFHQSLRLSGRSRATSSARLREIAQQQVVKASDYQFNFHYILQNRETTQEFLRYLHSTATEEGLLFMMAVDDLNQRIIHENVVNQTNHFAPDEQEKNDHLVMSELFEMSKKIYDQFIVPKCNHEINIAGEIRNKIYLDMQHLQSYFDMKSAPQQKQNSSEEEESIVDLDTFKALFKTAYNSVRVNLESDAFVRFTRSQQWDSFFSKNFVRLCSMNRGFAIHRSKVQIKQRNRTDFIREFITDRDLHFGFSLVSSSQFWTCVYEKEELNNLKVYHSGNEHILDRKALEVYGAMPVIKYECIFTCSHHELIKLISSEQYGLLIGFLGTDISTAISKKKPVAYTKKWYLRSNERESRINPSLTYRRRRNEFIIRDHSGDRVYNTGAYVCEVPMPGLQKRRMLSQCTSTMYLPDKKSYYRITKPIVTPEDVKTSKCNIVYSFSFIQIQEIAEGSCRFTQYVASNGNVVTGRSTSNHSSIDSARDTEEDFENTMKNVDIVKIASKVKAGAKMTCEILNFALWDYYLNRPKLIDLCFYNQCLKDNTKEEEEENQKREKIKQEEKKRTGNCFFQGLLSKVEVTRRLSHLSTSLERPSESILQRASNYV